MKTKYWYVCLCCGKTRDNLNKDGECRYCVRRANIEARISLNYKYPYMDREF